MDGPPRFQDTGPPENRSGYYAWITDFALSATNAGGATTVILMAFGAVVILSGISILRRPRDRRPRELALLAKPKTLRIVFRLSDIPLEWTRDQVCIFMKESIPRMDCVEVDHLVLYPSINAKRQVGILTLTGPQEVIEGIAPQDPDRPRRAVKLNDVEIMIDRHFFGLTPLNNAKNTPVIE